MAQSKLWPEPRSTDRLPEGELTKHVLAFICHSAVVVFFVLRLAAAMEIALLFVLRADDGHALPPLWTGDGLSKLSISLQVSRPRRMGLSNADHLFEGSWRLVSDFYFFSFFVFMSFDP